KRSRSPLPSPKFGVAPSDTTSSNRNSTSPLKSEWTPANPGGPRAGAARPDRWGPREAPGCGRIRRGPSARRGGPASHRAAEPAPLFGEGAGLLAPGGELFPFPFDYCGRRLGGELLVAQLALLAPDGPGEAVHFAAQPGALL